jgi:hypothetical protein
VQPAVDHRKPRRVVTAVLEPPDALDQDRDHIAEGDRTDDAAHASLPFLRPFPVVARDLRFLVQRQ